MSSFPSISSQEPPPLDSTSEDEDSEEFRTPGGFKLDLNTSAEPSPISTPRKSIKIVSPILFTNSTEENGHNDSGSDIHQPRLLDPGGEDDDFGDFADFQEAPSTSSKSFTSALTSTSTSTCAKVTSPRSSVDFTAALESKFDTLIKTVIPKEESPPTPNGNFTLIEKELSETTDYCWSHTVDFEDSRALLHKWINSSCQGRLYRSLKIDTSTIVYTEKWGAIEVPRFAASMVETPILQPQVCSSIRTNDSTQPQRKGSSQEDNPIIPNGQPLSIEAQQIIQKIPDISYMTAKTLVFPQAAASSNFLL